MKNWLKIGKILGFLKDRKTYITVVVLLPILCTLLVTTLLQGHDGGWIADLLGAESKFEVVKLIGWATGGLLAMLGVWVANRRAKAMEDQAAAANKQVRIANDDSREERFRDGVAHLGHKESSVRLGGIYGLYQLAEDYREIKDKQRSANIIGILHAHIRQTSSSEKYQQTYKDRPSEEIQSMLDLLCQKKKEDKEEPLRGTNGEIDLSRAWLHGASLYGARLQGANLEGTQLHGAYLTDAQLQGAYLEHAQLQGANLEHAQLQGANLEHAQLQGADLEDAQLQGTRLTSALLQGACLMLTQLQKADLNRAQLQWANLQGALLQGAYLTDAQLQAANLQGALLQGATLWYAQLQGATLVRAELQGADLKSAQLQGANLRNTQLQGADLMSAQLQGADLMGAQLQGADLMGAQLQGADLRNAKLHGVHSKIGNRDIGLPPFKDNIQKRVGCESDHQSIIFSNGLEKSTIEKVTKAFEEGIKLMEQSPIPSNRSQSLRSSMGRVLESMGEHLGKPASHTPPEEAITGTYSQEEADHWIANYERVMDPKKRG